MCAREKQKVRLGWMKGGRDRKIDGERECGFRGGGQRKREGEGERERETERVGVGVGVRERGVCRPAFIQRHIHFGSYSFVVI